MTTFPYLKVSRDFGIDYAVVLQFVALLDRMRGKPDGWLKMTPWRQAAVFAWDQEQKRRASA